MKKLKNMDINIKEEIDKMSKNDRVAIIDGIHSEIPILNLNAIVFGTKFKNVEPEFIDNMKEKFTDSKVTFLGNELGKFVSASLHLLGVQKYSGDDLLIKNLIKSKFEF